MPVIKPHKRIAPGAQGACPTNIVTFENYPMIPDFQVIRKKHIDDLRTAINGEETRRAKTNTIWTDDPTIVENKTLPRQPHMAKPRTAIKAIRDPSEYESHSCSTNQDVPHAVICPADVIVTELNEGGTVRSNCVFCQDYCLANVKGYCPSDVSAAITWTDDPIVADKDHVRAVHMNEAMEKVNIQRQQCVCEQECCNYCADCGYSYKQWYSGCDHSACACDDHQSSECSRHHNYNTYYWVERCSLVNSAETDFVTALQAKLYEGISSGDQVPWNCMCSFTPPGKNWKLAKASWGCMCNPFIWKEA